MTILTFKGLNACTNNMITVNTASNIGKGAATAPGMNDSRIIMVSAWGN